MCYFPVSRYRTELCNCEYVHCFNFDVCEQIACSYEAVIPTSQRKMNVLQTCAILIIKTNGEGHRTPGAHFPCYKKANSAESKSSVVGMVVLVCDAGGAEA